MVGFSMTSCGICNIQGSDLTSEKQFVQNDVICFVLIGVDESSGLTNTHGNA